MTDDVFSLKDMTKPTKKAKQTMVDYGIISPHFYADAVLLTVQQWEHKELMKYCNKLQHLGFPNWFKRMDILTGFAPIKIRKGDTVNVIWELRFDDTDIGFDIKRTVEYENSAGKSRS